MAQQRQRAREGPLFTDETFSFLLRILDARFPAGGPGNIQGNNDAMARLRELLRPGSHSVDVHNTQAVFLSNLAARIFGRGPNPDGRYSLDFEDRRYIVDHLLGDEARQRYYSSEQARDSLSRSTLASEREELGRIIRSVLARPFSSADDVHSRITLPVILHTSIFLSRNPDALTDFATRTLTDSLIGARRYLRLKRDNFYRQARRFPGVYYGRSGRGLPERENFRETARLFNQTMRRLDAAARLLQRSLREEGRARSALADRAMLEINSSFSLNNRLSHEFNRATQFLEQHAARAGLREMVSKTVIVALSALCPPLLGMHFTMAGGAAYGLGSTVAASAAGGHMPSAEEALMAMGLGAASFTRTAPSRWAPHGGHFANPVELYKTYYEIGHATHARGEMSLYLPAFVVSESGIRQREAMILHRLVPRRGGD